MVNSKIRLNFILLILSLFIFTIYIFHYQSGVSISPSFSRQEIIDKDSDWQPLYGVCDTRSNPIIKQLYSAPDIQAVSYNSNGKTLNATIVLSNSSKDFLSSSFRPEVNYHMVIQPASHYDSPSRHAGVYADEVYYNYTTEKWVRWIYESFSNGVIREIYKNNNYTGFFDKDKKFISFSLDLNSVSSPTEYLLSFATIVYGNVNEKTCSLKDDTDWYQIPLPQFTTSSTQSSIELRPGEEKNVELKVTSPLKRLGSSNVTISTKPISELRISPDSSRIAIPGEASGSAFFNIKASEDLKDDKLPITRTLVMDLLITIPGFTQQHRGQTIAAGSLTNNISESFSDLTITIVKRLTFEEKFMGFWDAYGSVISLVGGGFAAGFTALLFDRMKKKKKDDTK